MADTKGAKCLSIWSTIATLGALLDSPLQDSTALGTGFPARSKTVTRSAQAEAGTKTAVQMTAAASLCRAAMPCVPLTLPCLGLVCALAQPHATDENYLAPFQFLLWQSACDAIVSFTACASPL